MFSSGRRLLQSSVRRNAPRWRSLGQRQASRAFLVFQAQQQVQQQPSSSHHPSSGRMSAAALALLLLAGGGGCATSRCEEEAQAVTPSSVAGEDFEALQGSHDLDQMPVYTEAEMAQRNGDNGTPIWMSYGGVIYDVTDFIHNHPGGSEKIIQAAGSAIEPYWYMYRQHFASDLPMRLMEHMAVGRLDEKDQEAIDEQMEALEKDDPYAREPDRHPHLRVHSDTPMNAEVPTRDLTKSYLTPNDLFYIRHHHPVPFLTEKQLHDFRLKVDLTAYKKNGSAGKVLKLSLDELKKLPKVAVTATLQCSGNRRGGFNAFQRTSGTPWGASGSMEWSVCVQPAVCLSVSHLIPPSIYSFTRLSLFLVLLTFDGQAKAQSRRPSLSVCASQMF